MERIQLLCMKIAVQSIDYRLYNCQLCRIMMAMRQLIALLTMFQYQKAMSLPALLDNESSAAGF
jgi:hypothetical protein